MFTKNVFFLFFLFYSFFISLLHGQYRDAAAALSNTYWPVFLPFPCAAAASVLLTFETFSFEDREEIGISSR